MKRHDLGHGAIVRGSRLGRAVTSRSVSPEGGAGARVDAFDDAALISDRFALGELLGTGGSASVFAATDRVTGAAVALKVLHPQLSGPEATREAFFRQARAASAIRHPNVAGVVALGTDLTQSPPVVWIACERARGVSLAELVDERGALEIADAIALAEGMLLGIAAAHAAGVIHRDLSPGNIMVSPGMSITPESVRIIDFGLADAAGRPVVGIDVVRTAGRPADAARDGVLPNGGEASGPPQPGVLGTVHYLSPEQARGDAVDERSDLYQLSAVLYFALTGQPPYPRDSAAETMSAHLHAPPPVPSTVRQGVPRELDRLVVKGMLKSQQNRFASAEQMLEAVSSLSASQVFQTSQTFHQHPPDRSASGRLGDAAETTSRADAARPPARRTVAPTRVLPNPATAATHILGSPTGLSRPAGSGAGVGSASTSSRRKSRPVRAGWLAGLGVAALAVVVGGFIAAFGSTLAPVVVATESSTPTSASSGAPTEPTAEPSDTASPEQVDVPPLSGLPLAAARSALATAGLNLGAVSLADSAAAEGTVIGSSRGAGEQAEAGWSVDLVVASGFNLIPAVVGSSAPEASAALSAAGFTVSIATAENPGHTAKAQSVLSVDPGAGTRATVGRSILITVASDGGVTPAPTTSPPPIVAPTSTPSPLPTSPGATPPPAQHNP